MISITVQPVFGYTDVIYPEERPPEVWKISPETPCISNVNLKTP
jgi:hypothetical protein